MEMQSTEKILRKMDQGKLLRTFGARRGKTRISAGLRHRLAYWQDKLPLLLDPRICHEKIPVTHETQHRVGLPDGNFLSSPNLARTVADATELCCFVATIGPGVEVAVNSCMAENRHADAFILDALGSMAAEAFIDGFHRDYEGQCRTQGQGVTLRFSPGYCDWDISDQIHLFSVFKDAHPADVELTEACLMSPCKSISGVFGILPFASDSNLDKYNPCRSCRQRNCRGRRT